MCRMTLLAATVLGLSATALAAGPAAADINPFHFGRAPAPAAAPASQTPASQTPAASPGAGRAAPAAPPVAEPPPQRATAEQRIEVERLDPLARAAFWAHEVEVDPRDAESGVRLAHALRDMGRFQEAADAAGRVLVVNPAYYDALLEQGRARIGQGQGFYAIEPLQRAAAQTPSDWRPISLLAVAYEQVQRDDDALAAHRRALEMSPNNPGLLSNLALYWAGHGDTAQAETLLRRAVALPGVTAQTRQNLALVLGLQGRLDEAERLARQDLPPEVVANNMAYLRAASAPSGGRNWDALRSPQTP